MNGAILDLDGQLGERLPRHAHCEQALDRVEGRYAGPNTEPGISGLSFGTSPTWNNKL